MNLIWIAVIVGVIGLAFVGYLASTVLKKDAGTARIKEITSAIEEGALAFLKREYITLGVFVVVVFIAMAVIPGIRWEAAVVNIFMEVTVTMPVVEERLN